MKSRKRFACIDCAVDTGKIGEHYMLRDAVWFSVHDSRSGMLCIGCIEARLGRELKPADFTDGFLNRARFARRSMRLSIRLGLTR